MMDKILYTVAFALLLGACGVLLHGDGSGTTLYSVAFSVALTGYVVGLLEDIRNAVVDDGGMEWEWETAAEKEE